MRVTKLKPVRRIATNSEPFSGVVRMFLKFRFFPRSHPQLRMIPEHIVSLLGIL